MSETTGDVLADADLQVGVVGAGTMGAGIAEVAARAGHRVLVLDAAPGATPT
ncbi:3-hydroxyacyl-CoA dehydrogenase NAD-binding domain-containing protein, partial [Angustibacter speluncae]